MKPRIKSVSWNIRKQKTTNQNKKEKRNPKNEDNVRILWGSFKKSNIHILVMTGEEKEQEIGTLFEK